MAKRDRTRQSAKDRLERLSDSRCPIHGVVMSQFGLAMVDGNENYVVKCSRKDCGIKGTVTDLGDPNGLVTLLLEFQPLLGPHAVLDRKFVASIDQVYG